MFDKIKFSQILNKINSTYDSMTEFSEKSKVNRTYLSQYINQKLDSPPSPKVLLKIANNSNKMTNYEELMLTCGYLEKNMEIDEVLKNIFNQYLPILKELKLDDELINTMYNMTFEAQKYGEKFDKLASKLPIETQNKVYTISSEILSKTKEVMSSTISDISLRVKYNLNSNLTNKLFNIPVLGKIAAGQPLLAEEYLEGYLPVDPNIYGMTTPDDYFYLKVAGESMNLKVHNGDYALIHKQDYADDGDIIVAIVNGDDEATLKKYKIINESTIALEPMSTLPMEPIYVNLKETNFKIIGKAIGQFGKF
uniref:LexA repressor n=1 Tax=Siphoviridae sp. ctRCE13 TaxID=2826332 RepID=A0A8S5QQK3_9CAUD|nr:MAG TPA: LexA repressor [Siphoviridae sp. ctRCE13]